MWWKGNYLPVTTFSVLPCAEILSRKINIFHCLLVLIMDYKLENLIIWEIYQIQILNCSLIKILKFKSDIPVLLTICAKCWYHGIGEKRIAKSCSVVKGYTSSRSIRPKWDWHWHGTFASEKKS